MNKTALLLIPAFAAVFLACDKSGNTVEQADYEAILLNVTDEVVVPTYADLYQKTIVLVGALDALRTNQNQTNLDAARQAWRDARVPWEKSEGFLYGPVETLGIDPAIDSWPVNQADLDAVLSSSDALTKSFLDAQEGTVKGFHTLEYLLFGANGSKQANEFTPRQFEYLVACAQSLEGACFKLHQNWVGGTVNFGNTFKTAGKNGNVAYPSQKSALQEILNGLITIADEVANGKINEPFAQQDLLLEESRFSANSKADFADNIRSIQNVYTGIYTNAEGKGLSALVKEKDPALDTNVRRQIADAVSAIEGIEGTFTSAIFNAKPSVEKAREEVRALQELLQNQVFAVIDGL